MLKELWAFEAVNGRKQEKKVMFLEFLSKQ
jgi:hypothetical protein